MINGYNGLVLFVDLTSGDIKEKTLPEQVYRHFIGGQGLGARILYEYMKPGAEPLGPENLLGFVVGPLTGVGAHGARFQVVGKSPITGGWGDSNCGGSFAGELKAAGYDGVFFSGISPKPVYLFLNEGQAEIRDAGHLWGKDTAETEAIIRNELNDKSVRIACIGPAGELESLISTIMHEGSAAARGGLAAVMGSKRLKAFATKGTKKVQMAHPELVAALRKDYLQGMKKTEDEGAVMLKTWGTCALVSPCVVTGDTPIKNWTLFGEEGFPNHSKISGDEITKYQTKKHACRGCPVACKGWMEVEDSIYGDLISRCNNPEFTILENFCSIPW